MMSMMSMMMMRFLVVVLVMCSPTESFVPSGGTRTFISIGPVEPTRLIHSALPPSLAEFEYQEIRAQLNAMERQQIPLSQRRQDVLQQYLQSIASLRPSTIPLRDIHRVLPGTTWKLVLSSIVPPCDTILLEFDANESRVNYCLEFKIWGLSRLVAKSNYQVTEDGIVMMEYEELTTDVLGFQNVGLGGVFQGRVTSVESVFMDARFWIERVNGGNGYNVYQKQGVDGDTGSTVSR